MGQRVKLRPFQQAILRRIYNSPTRRAIISFARKNAKTTLSAFLLLLHLVGPEARANSQLFSAAQSRDQAALKQGAKTARELSDELDISLAQVKNRLTDGKGTWVTPLDQVGKEFRWGLLSHRT